MVRKQRIRPPSSYHDDYYTDDSKDSSTEETDSYEHDVSESESATSTATDAVPSEHEWTTSDSNGEGLNIQTTAGGNTTGRYMHSRHNKPRNAHQQAPTARRKTIEARKTAPKRKRREHNSFVKQHRSKVLKRLREWCVPRKVSFSRFMEPPRARQDRRHDLDRLPSKLRFFRSMAHVDRKYSRWLQQWKWPLLDLCLFPFAVICGAYATPLVLAIAMAFWPSTLSLALTVSTLLTVIATGIGKKQFKRIRPPALFFSHRFPDVRALVNNESFPSGDSAQAAVVGVTLACYTGIASFLWVIPLTMWGRVHFGCHYIGDTIVGAFTGAFVAFSTVLVLHLLDWCYEIRSLLDEYVFETNFLPDDLCDPGFRLWYGS